MRHVTSISRVPLQIAQTGDTKQLVPNFGFWDWWVLITQGLIWIVQWLGTSR